MAGKEYFTISAVASMFNVHPQTLRLYEARRAAASRTLGGQHAALLAPGH